MTSNKNIALLIPNLQSGGAEKVLTLTSVVLEEAGYNVYFFVFDSENISYDYSGKLIDLKTFQGSSVLIKVINRIIRIIKLTLYKRKYNIDTIISFLYSANVVNYFSPGKAQKIISCRGYGDFVKNGSKYASMLPNIHSLIVQTERLKNDFKKQFNVYENNIDVLYNPFDIRGIKKLAEEKIEKEIEDFLENHDTICTVGSFKKDKGYWHLIKSFIELKKTCKKAGLIFIGHRGEMEEEIKQMALKSGYSKDIKFLGYQSNPFKYVSKSDVYVCSSLFEGFPNSIVEAMACGTPIVSTDCLVGPREILSGNNNENIGNSSFFEYGILSSDLSKEVDFDIEKIDFSERELAKNISKILLDKKIQQHYSTQALERVSDFKKEEYLNKLLKIIDND